MIHGGLELNFKSGRSVAQNCCVRPTRFLVDTETDYWKNHNFVPLREHNKQNVWAPGCENCQRLESAGQTSFRSGMNQGLGISGQYDLSGPARIDLSFDNSCNLACRSCNAVSSTFWQKHLKDHNEWNQPIIPVQTHDDVISALKKLDLSNLRMLVFSGGETLLGQAYWEVARWLSEHVPNTKQQLTLCFQTNGTQPIHPRNYELIDRFHLVKLHISLDGTSKRFEYLRWPANWNQVVDNIMQIRESAPSNTMFLVEETVSIFNLFYQAELDAWVKNNFSSNREGDPINHTRHICRDDFRLDNCTQEYVDAMQHTDLKSFIPSDWQENPENIKQMISVIKKFDGFRNESFEKTFPEVAAFYNRYL
jgi:sulfatase maturation enzyme AslB (radical SAM superfamily)